MFMVDSDQKGLKMCEFIYSNIIITNVLFDL